jgi:hypothetical protein
MSWVKRKLRDWLLSDRKVSESAVSSRDSESVPNDEPILTFRLYRAVNGQVLEFRRWDRNTDRSYITTYIIEKDKDLAEYVSKCVSMESLK